MPSIAFPSPAGYTDTPWTDQNGKLWVADAKGRWLEFDEDAGVSSASDVSFNPTGSIAAITVQAAINELATEKAPLASPSFTGTVTSAGNISTNGAEAHIRALGGGNLETTSGQFIGAGTGLTGTAANLVAGAALTITRTTAPTHPTVPILAIGQMCRVGNDPGPYTWYRAETLTSWVLDGAEIDWTVEPVNSFSINAKSAPFNASGSDTETTLSVAMTAGATSATVTSAASFKAGQGINITGAGVAGAAYIGQIVSVAGSVITVTPAISTSVTISARVRHDDTAAIQAALNSLEFTGGSILLPAGVYNINGPLQDTGGSNSKIVIPKASYDDYNYPLHFTIEGASVPAPTSRPNKGGAALLVTDGDDGWVFNSSYVGALSHPSAAFIADATVHWVYFKNLAFRAPENPTIGLIGGQFGAMFIDNMTIDVGRQPAAGYFAGNPFAKPTNDTTAIKTPPDSNAARAIIRNFFCYGYGNPIFAQEHADMANIYISKCVNAIKVKSGGHGIYGARIQVEYATNVIKAEGVLVSLKISHLGTENISGVLIHDPSNQIAGTVEYSMQNPSGGPVVNGAAFVKLQNLRNFNLDNGSFQALKAAPYSGPSVTLDKMASSPEDTTALVFNYKGVYKGDITFNNSTGRTSWYLPSGSLTLNIGGFEMFNFSYGSGMFFNGSLHVNVAGQTFLVKTGTNALAGTVTLASGIGTITSTAITTDTIIMLSLVTSSGTPALAAPLAKVNAGSANVTGAMTDNSTYNWIALKKY